MRRLTYGTMVFGLMVVFGCSDDGRSSVDKHSDAARDAVVSEDGSSAGASDGLGGQQGQPPIDASDGGGQTGKPPLDAQADVVPDGSPDAPPSGPCESKSCPREAAFLCDDGSLQQRTCERNDLGMCAWVAKRCPLVSTCTPELCGHTFGVFRPMCEGSITTDKVLV